MLLVKTKSYTLNRKALAEKNSLIYWCHETVEISVILNP